MNFETKREIPAGPNCHSADGKKCDFLYVENGDCHDYYSCHINNVLDDPISENGGPTFLHLHSGYLRGETTEDRHRWWLPKDQTCVERFPEGTIITTAINMWAYPDKESLCE